ncbi:MAG: hypothetical protein V2A67_05700 [Bacteroidota bacterium]
MKHRYLNTIGQYFFYALLAISVVLTVIFYLNTGNANPNDSVGKQMADLGSILNILFYWTYLLTAIAIVLAIGLPLVNIIGSEPKKIFRLLIGIVAIGVLVFIAYQFSDGTIMNIAGYSGTANVPSTLKLVDTVMFTLYGMVVIAAISLIYAEISKLFK